MSRRLSDEQFRMARIGRIDQRLAELSDVVADLDEAIHLIHLEHGPGGTAEAIRICQNVLPVSAADIAACHRRSVERYVQRAVDNHNREVEEVEGDEED